MNMFCSKRKQNPLPARDLTASLKLEQENIICLIIFEENPQRLFVLFVPFLTTGAFYRSVPPNQSMYETSSFYY